MPRSRFYEARKKPVSVKIVSAESGVPDLKKNLELTCGTK